MALLLAVSSRLATLRSRRWRYISVALVVGLVVWPTSVAPVRSLGSALGHAVQLANATWGWRAALERDETAAQRRYAMPAMSSRLAAYIRGHTDVDANVLDTTKGLSLLLHTGRPSNSGFVGVVQQALYPGPEYLDARHYLEPAAIRRLSLGYVYATDAWVAELPARARGWLADSCLFELLVRDADEALYRVRPAFQALETVPHPESFEALRAEAPPYSEIYLPPQTKSDVIIRARMTRVASALPQARLVGGLNSEYLLHLLTPAPWTVAPLGTHEPELVALPLLHEAWQYPPAGWHEVWRSPPGGVAVYAPSTSGETLANAAPPDRFRVSDVRVAEERLAFTATFDAHMPSDWSGQDWVLVPIVASPWGIPALEQDGQPNIEQWFAGQAAAGGGTTTHSYVFDARASTLSVLGADGAYTAVQASDRTPAPGVWMLALRLTRWVDNGVQEPALITPVLRIEVSSAGTVSYQVYEAAHGWWPA